MTDQAFVIDLDDTEGHAISGTVEPRDTEWLEDRLRRDGGKARFRVVPREDEDTEAHALGETLLRVALQDEDDTEGHAIAIRFPSRADADTFRRRLLLTGVVVGTVALGTAGGVGLAAIQSDTGTGAAITQGEASSNYEEAAANEAARQGGGAQTSVTNPQPADALSAYQAARQGGGAQTSVTNPQPADALSAYQAARADAQASANYEEAATNEAARQGGAAQTSVTNPQPADAVSAYQATRADAQASANYEEAAANEAARQGGGAATQSGPMDVHEAPAFQSSTTDEGLTEPHDSAGPTPR